MTLFVTKNGQQLGPYSLEQVQNLVANGTLVASDWAWYEGAPDWVQITQIPGFVLPITTYSGSTATSPTQTRTRRSHAERPALVWVISIFYCFGAAFSLFSLALIPFMLSGAIPINDTQRTYFESQSFVDYGLTAVITLCNLTGAILLFMLRRQAIYFFATAFLSALCFTGYQIVAKNWFGAVGGAGMVGAFFGWGINLAIIGYVWSLVRKDILH